MSIGSSNIGSCFGPRSVHVPFEGVMCVNSDSASVPYVGLVGSCSNRSVKICGPGAGSGQGICGVVRSGHVGCCAPTSCARKSRLSGLIGAVVSAATSGRGLVTIRCVGGRRRMDRGKRVSGGRSGRGRGLVVSLRGDGDFGRARSVVSRLGGVGG